ncbi:fibronectin type III domain-containing protein [Corynebacterium sp. ES2715-CONJ3]|uniref:fibronectin type III domain-containing protein n=1 Tax=Corynebacterium sp. ES2715-CONJ3 TaxID=2974028 RepID=UPI00216A9F72|nr:fibronectin type III domain-containing protein [Corynebacterium sp. ES2715-CONJ3]MCS4491729.1 hypothetical protein [Corynebacterium sp. ES2715-CONJ3]
MSAVGWRRAIIAGTTASSLLFTLPVAQAVQAVPSESTVESPSDSNETPEASLPRVLADGPVVRVFWDAIPGAKGYTATIVLPSKSGEVVSPKHGVFTQTVFTEVPAGTYRVKVEPLTNNPGADTPIFSEEFTVSHDITVPQKPNEPQIELLKGSKARVWWSRTSNGGARVEHSMVTLIPNDGSQVITAKADGELNEIEIGGLKLNTTYTASVAVHNEIGDSEPAKSSDSITVTADPGDISLNLNPPLIDPTKENTFVLSGSGLTGGAVEKGFYVVVWNTKQWEPGYRPWLTEDDTQLSYKMSASDITNGTFTKQITIPADTFDISKGDRYIVGITAENFRNDRRLDRAIEIIFTPLPVTNVTAEASDASVSVSWAPARDHRVREYVVKLFNAETNELVKSISRGKNITSTSFEGLKAGRYYAKVVSNIQSDSSGQAIYSPEARSTEVEIASSKVKTVPSAVQSVILGDGRAAGSLKISWIDGPREAGQAKITGYRIIFTDGTKTVTKTAEPLDSLLEFNGFTQGTWTATIIAESAAGDSAASAVSNSHQITEKAIEFTPEFLLSNNRINATRDTTIRLNGSGYFETDSVDVEVLDLEGTTSLLKVTAPVSGGELNYELRISAGTLEPGKKYRVRTQKGDKYRATQLLSTEGTEVANPQISFDQRPLDPTMDNVVRVNGSGFYGDGTAKGVYVTIQPQNAWRPGTPAHRKGEITAQHISVDQLRDGRFTVDLIIPKGVLTSSDAPYMVNTFAAHALSQTDRSLDSSTPLPVDFGSAATPDPEVSPTPTPKPDPQPAPEPTPDDNSEGSSPGIIAASVIGSLTALAAIIGAVINFFPQIIQTVKGFLRLP